jgi:hypothetical protein
MSLPSGDGSQKWAPFPGFSEQAALERSGENREAKIKQTRSGATFCLRS